MLALSTVGVSKKASTNIATAISAEAAERNVAITTASSNAVAVAQFPSLTRMVFQQSTAPTGWTKDVTAAFNDSVLRFVTGSVGSGGSYSLSAGCTVVAAHTHTFTSGTESADHSHSGSTGGISANHTHALDNGMMKALNEGGPGRTDGLQGAIRYNTGTVSADHSHSFSTGGRSAAHTHSGTTANNASAATWIPKYVDIIVCTKN